jgi:hypothetical protein
MDYHTFHTMELSKTLSVHFHKHVYQQSSQEREEKHNTH